MATLNILRTRDLLQKFDFPTLFIEELGWSRPSFRKPETWTCNGATFERRQIAELSGVVVFEIIPQDGNIPDAKTRAAIHKDVAKLHHENLLTFLDQKRTQSLWYWVKREDGKSYPREHPYVRGQPGNLFLSKLGVMVVDLGDFDDTGAVSVVEVAARLKKSLDVEKVTKKFYREFYDQHLAFLELIQGIDDERQRRWYASVLLNRLMFIYFLQRKKLALFCSTRCPGNLILQTYDLARALRDARVTVMGGFHSPMEKECLSLLLRGTQPVIVCPARSLERMRLPAAWHTPLAEGRLLLLSPFSGKLHRATASLAKKRNEFVAALAEEIFVAYAAPGSKTEHFCREVLSWGKPLLTLESDDNADLIARGAKRVRPENVSGQWATVTSEAPQTAQV